MITKYKIFESYNDIRVGDYIIIKDTYSPENPASWDNNYGQVIDLGVDDAAIAGNCKIYKFCLVRYMNYLSSEELAHIKSSNDNNSHIKSLYGFKKDKSDICSWVCDEYCIKYNKDDFDKKVEEIEMKKDANKYNI